MFHCERCQGSFNPTVAEASSRTCPRCRAEDDVSAPLHFRIFEPSALSVASLSPKPAKELPPKAEKPGRPAA
jgi:hypothetical protein